MYIVVSLRLVTKQYDWCWLRVLVAKWLGCWTCNQQVAHSNPGLPAVEYNPGQVVNTHVPLSPRCIIWYQPDLRLPSQPQGITAHWLVPNYTSWWQRHMCVNNLPRVALDSRAAGIRTRDLLIANLLCHRATTTTMTQLQFSSIRLSGSKNSSEWVSRV